MEFVHHTEYDANFNDTTIAYTDKYGLCLIMHEKVQKENSKKDKIIISLKLGLLKTHELELNISFSIRKQIIKHYLKHLSGITKIMTLWGITLLECTMTI